MAAIRSKNAKAEILLRKTLTQKGVRYRLHGNLAGRPDLIFMRAKIAVFCDGDFWHGRNWKKRKQKGFNVRSSYWVKKIESNIARDRQVNADLRKARWTALRYWESEIRNDVEKICDSIMRD